MPSVLDWWFSQLADCLPAAWVRSGAEPNDAIILELDRQFVRVVIRASGNRTRAADIMPNEAGAQELARFLRSDTKLPRALYLRPAPSHVLHKHVTLPAAARRDLEQVLGFEIDRETPFSSDEVHWTYNVRRSDGPKAMLDIDLFLVPRPFVDPLLAELQRAGLAITAIEADIGAGATVSIRMGNRPRGQRLGIERPLLPLATAAAVFLLFAATTPFIVQQWVYASAESVMAALTGPAREAASLRQTVDRATRGADFLKEQHSHTPSALTILAAVTDALPDDTYLNALSMRDGKITLSGFSASAADLIGTLAKTPGFAKPAFDAPVVQTGENDLESFTISAALTQEGAQ